MDWLHGPGSDRADSGMGHFRVAVQAGHRTGERFEPMEALVDTGATYTWVPRDVLERLGVVPEEEWPFVLADGREVRYPMAWIRMRLGERVQPTIAVFGEPRSTPRIGSERGSPKTAIVGCTRSPSRIRIHAIGYRTSRPSASTNGHSSSGTTPRRSSTSRGTHVYVAPVSTSASIGSKRSPVG